MMPYEINSIEADDCYIGTVLTTDFETRELGVYIPKLMPQISKDLYNETSLTVKTALNIKSNIVKDNIKKVSYMMVKALNKHTPMPKEGSKVVVSFIEGDPESGFWCPFNVMGIDYEEDPDDKFEKEKLFTINFKYNDDEKNTGEYTKSIDIHKNDNITFTIDSNIRVNVSRDSKDRSNVNITLMAGD